MAVGDIESVQRNAKLKREAMQVHLHVELERKMPRKLLEKVNEMEYELNFKNCLNTSILSYKNYFFLSHIC